MDKALIKACLKNNQQAQNKLYDRYKGRMYTVCLRYARSKEEAEDFLLEGFYKVFMDLHQFNGKGQLEGWIKKVIINNALMTLRKRKIILLPIAEMETQEQSQNPEIWQQMETDSILEAIQQLPEGYRTIFNLFAIEGYAHKEIAEKLGIVESASRSQYSRAKQALQRILLTKNVVS